MWYLTKDGDLINLDLVCKIYKFDDIDSHIVFKFDTSDHYVTFKCDREFTNERDRDIEFSNLMSIVDGKEKRQYL